MSAWFEARTSGPLIVGHRGASFDLPENTLAALTLAVEQGADGIEFDLRLSADGHLIICHDATLTRLAGDPRQVCDMTIDEVQSVRLAHDLTIPTLDELFETLGSQTLYNLELKGMNWRDNGLEAAAADRVSAHGLEQFVLISSFNPFSLRRARAAFPRTVPLALLRAAPGYPFSRWLAGTAVDHPHYKLINDKLMEQARKAGTRIHAWTVDDIVEARRLHALGVHGIITNQPAYLRRALLA